MKAWKLAIEKEFGNCLKKFPELYGIGFVVESSSELFIAVAQPNGRQTIILSVPPELQQNKPVEALNIFILYGLSQMLNPKKADKIFMERVTNDKYKKLFQLLKKDKILKVEK